jgi:hypothetical protein
MPPSFYRRLSRKPEAFRSFTGLDVAEFDSLLSRVALAYDDHERKRLTRRDRKYEIGGGRPFKLALEDRLLMLLMYYRTYITSILLGFTFNLDQSNVLKDIRMLEPLVKECIPLPEKLHEMARRARTFEEVERYFPGFKAFVDATEQAIPRPTNALKRKTHYSGKRKMHTVKTQLTVNSEGLILHRTDHARGRRNDLEIYSKRHPSLPSSVEQGFDRGYHGVTNYFPDLNCAVPFKKVSPGRGHRGEKAPDLTPEQKAYNKRLSKARVVVEHTISRVKKFNIFGTEFRNRLKSYDVMTDLVCGLVNFRILGA